MSIDVEDRYVELVEAARSALSYLIMDRAHDELMAFAGGHSAEDFGLPGWEALADEYRDVHIALLQDALVLAQERPEEHDEHAGRRVEVPVERSRPDLALAARSLPDVTLDEVAESLVTAEFAKVATW